jgi:hypothetical protein
MVAYPRYFQPAASGPAPDVPPHDAAVAQVVDAFALRDADWLVGVDPLGRLLATDDEARLLPGAHAALVNAELQQDARRRVEASELWLFDLKAVENPPDEPGPNDPVYLYGTLYGPLPVARGLALPAVHGQLVVTRADLLEGFVQAERWGFRQPSVRGTPGPLCRHLLLPGDREEALAERRGLVLAYPMMPPEVAVESPGNESAANLVLREVLAALVEELRVKPKGAFARMLARPGPLEMPETGSFPEHLALAGRALEALVGWPSAKALALRSAVVKSTSRAVISTPTHEPARPLPRIERVWRPPSAPADDWMQDFLRAHRKPGGRAPRVTYAAPPTRDPARAEWRQDFAHAAAREEQEPAPKPSPGRPDWMKDFE